MNDHGYSMIDYHDEEYDEHQSIDDYYYYNAQYHPAEIMQARVEHFDFKEEWDNLFGNCMGAVLIQSANQLVILLTLCFLFRLVSILLSLFSRMYFFNSYFLNMCSIIFGLISLHSINYDTFSSTVLIMVLYTVFSYFICFIFSKLWLKCGKMVSVFSVTYLIIGELLINAPQQWHQIRGVLLLLAMKTISFAFDLDNKHILKVPNILSYFGYCWHCGTLWFGPWISYEEYIGSILNPKPLSISWCIHVCKSLLLSFVCLLLSSCIFSYLFLEATQPELPSLTPFVANFWMLSYKSALSFHFSHFYICYLAQTTCMLSGIGAQKHSGAYAWSEFTITKPLSVEVPTSMLNVVVAWNIPMSKWLKEYVFNAYKSLGRTTAVLLTYVASAMLHGLSFHLAAVLLSLAFYTYVEYSLRMKLSRVFNCVYIQARPKPSDESYSVPFWAYLFNISWVLINLMHLAYLGAMFQSEDENLAQGGYPMAHTIEKWSNLGFFSHGFAIMCFVFNYFI